MKFVLLTTVSAKERWCEEATSLYLDKINYFNKFEIHQLRPSKNPRATFDKKVAEESQQILDFLKPDDFAILFDEEGQSLDSIDFSKKIEQVRISSKKRAVFILGGAYGVNQEVKQRAQLKISFSKMVFNHLVAQVVSLEQIYRAFTIINRLPYHNISNDL